MTTTDQSTIHTEPFENRIEELRFFCDLLAYAIKADFFRLGSDGELHRQADCIHRIAEKI